MSAIVRNLFAPTLAAFLIACGSDGGSPYQPSGTAPTISNLQLSRTTAYENEGDGRVDVVVTVEFSDPEGDQSSMGLNVLDSSGQLLYVGNSPITSVGQQSGTVQGTFGIVTSERGTFTIRIWLIDDSVRSSNRLDAEFLITEPPAQTTWYKDVDGDGHSDGDTQLSVVRPINFYMASELVALTGDCDDTNATVHPGGVEIDADGVDQDCSGFEISGPPEVVFDWTTDSCEDLDIPDLSARAFRDKNDQVQLISSHIAVRRSIGPGLDNLVHECPVVMSSHRDPDPAMFNDVEWIAATYTEDGETIFAIVHNEYEGWTHPGQCRTSRWTMDCWYNGLTLAVSTDVGLTYSHPVAPPLHLIAASSLQYEKDIGPSGIFAPTSIVKGSDGYYYAMAQRTRWTAPNTGAQWSCLMRTADLADPDAWRFWDGDMFEGRFVNPYTDPVANPEDHDCAPVDRDNIADMHESLVYSEYLDRYILAGASQDGDQYGFFISLSNDLINWTHRRLLLERHLPWTTSDPSEPVHGYPSLLDPQSTSRNFETIGKTAYVYYSRNNRQPGDLDRDMLRVPIEFFRYDPTAVPDQGQMFGTEGILQLGTDDWTQSITTGMSGQLTGIQLQFTTIPDPPGELTLSIYEGGNPVSGPELHSIQLLLSNSDLDATGLYIWDLSDAGLSFNVGEVFNIRFQALRNGFVISGNDPPGYEGGELYKNQAPATELSDIAFITYVKPRY